MSKKCKACHISKNTADFYPALRTKDKLRGTCKKCCMKQRRARLKKADPAQRRSVVLKNKYGITTIEFDQMLMNQFYSCKICGSRDPGPKGVFAVDHCHKTSKVRGLLCYLCNIGLGSFRDNQDFLASAITYLEDSKS